MQFRRKDRERVARGEITVTYRLWKRSQVAAGKSYRLGAGAIQVEDVRVIPAGLIPEEDIARSGLPDLASILELAGEHRRAQVGPETLLHRVQFRYLPGSPLASAAATHVDPGAIAERLAAMDRRSTGDPWTAAALRLIATNPGVPARLLAIELGLETREFKARVRRLKALGLTISHEVGYELSDMGRRAMAATTPAADTPASGTPARRV